MLTGAQERLVPAATLLAAALVGAIAGVEPKLAIALASGAAFLVLAFTALPVAIAIYCFEPIGIAVDESVAIQAAAVLLGISWLAAIAQRERGDGLATRWAAVMAGAVVLLVALALLSTAWAESPSAAISNALLYAGAFPLALLIISAIRTRETALLMATALFVGACATALYAFAVPRENFEEAGRLGSGSVDPNELASVLIVGVAFAGAMAVALRRSPLLRSVAIGGGILCLLAIALTVSRGGLVALIVAFVAALVLAGRWRPQVALAGLIIAAAGFYYFTALAPPEARERLAQANFGDARLLDGRTTLWQVGWRIVEDRPLTGVGGGNFEISSKHYLLQPGSLPRSDQIIDTPKVVHNTFLQFQTELGLLGLLLFTTLVGCALGAAGRAAAIFGRLQDRELEAISRATMVGLIGFLTACFFISQELAKHLWFLIGFGPALLAVAKRQEGV